MIKQVIEENFDKFQSFKRNKGKEIKPKGKIKP